MSRQGTSPLTGSMPRVRAPGFPENGTGLPPGQPGAESANAPRTFTATRRRSLPRVLAGVGLVVVCALIFAIMATRTGPQAGVLALSRDVAAGQVLSAGDLSVVDVSASSAAVSGLVPAGQESDWIGKTLTGPLPAGQLLNPANLGPSAWPPAGQAVVAVPLQAGHLPAGVVVGSQVRVVLSTQPSASAATSAGSPVAGSYAARTLAGSVVQIAGLSASGAGTSSGARSASPASASIGGDGAVLSLLMSSGDAAVVAASAAGDVSVILQGSRIGG